MTHPEQVLRSAKERETVNGAVRALRSAAPDGWERLDFAFRATVGIDSASLEVEDAYDACALMYRAGKGAWFTARLQIERSGRFSAEFDYDGEPDFTPPLTASAYAQDLDRFPRTAAHIPDWLRAKLDES